MENISEINLGNQLLSIVVAGGLVAFAFLVFRILQNSVKYIIKQIKRNIKGSTADKN